MDFLHFLQFVIVVVVVGFINEVIVVGKLLGAIL